MKQFYFLTLISFIFSQQQIEPITPIQCTVECTNYQICDTQLGKCIYKGFWPIYPMEFIEIIVLSTSSALATACGIGGGTVYSAFFLGVQKFEPLEAFPVSNCLILSCGLVTFIACVFDKYKHPTNKFVDYDLAILFAPSMLLGAKFGTIFNKIFSSLFLTVAVLLLLFYSVRTTYHNVQKAKDREAQYERQQAQAHMISLQTDHTEPLLTKEGINEEDKEPKELTEAELMIKNVDENPLRLGRIAYMILLEIILILDQFLEGNAKLNSFIGITRCSSDYWYIFIGYILISLIFLFIAYLMVMSHFRRRIEVDPYYKSERMNCISDHIFKIVILGMIAGTISSMVGIGGGMITNPLFASLGLDPKESSSTSNFLIITSATASTFLFSFAGQLNYSFALWTALPCTIAAFIGSFFILQYINRTKRSSILLVIMLYFLIASGIIILWKGYFDYRATNLMEFFTVKAYC